MQQFLLISALLAVVSAQFGGYQQQQGNVGFERQQGSGFDRQQQQQFQQFPKQQQGGFMQQQQQWESGRGMMGGAMDRGIDPLAGPRQRGPPFLQNVTRQAVFEYYQIFQNRNLTKAQITSAVGNWSTTYNVADQVAAFDREVEQMKQESRQNVTSAIQELPATLNQIYSIMDDQSLPPAQEQQKIGQIFSNLTYPLNVLTGNALHTGGRGGRGGNGRRGDDSGELIIFGF
ncbi:hypothetical protein PMAYCL1PPCAC_15750 [Pristionchus mayeri]|uniref:SXP/RAL-2 family protein Ani s 5-like cation-binding domain-containing protein n=1 Tax=Pristionchus mayeri TaxID=1317129 RepID=A0AAN5HYI4_9BILA|nr:hypothetical protein PMAYCL1PPCAC_15750 [Pristionchus mayeri]